ncbi:Uncharacterised protein [Mycobacteroides abscessus subsp. abscessus]|nr:Uncharacterised protein [Mycobacteroides abscessus subsp. abscessus]
MLNVKEVLLRTGRGTLTVNYLKAEGAEYLGIIRMLYY